MVDLRERKLGTEVEGREVMNGVTLNLIRTPNSNINLKRSEFSESSMLMWAVLPWGLMLMLILVGLHERHAVKRGIWARTQDFIYDQ
jgi:hypothetical protein